MPASEPVAAHNLPSRVTQWKSLSYWINVDKITLNLQLNCENKKKKTKRIKQKTTTKKQKQFFISLWITFFTLIL